MGAIIYENKLSGQRAQNAYFRYEDAAIEDILEEIKEQEEEMEV